MTEAGNKVDSGYQLLDNEIRSDSLGVGIARKGDKPPHAVFVACQVNAFGTELNVTYEAPPARVLEIIESLQEAIKIVESGEMPDEDGH